MNTHETITRLDDAGRVQRKEMREAVRSRIRTAWGQAQEIVAAAESYVAELQTIIAARKGQLDRLKMYLPERTREQRELTGLSISCPDQALRLQYAAIARRATAQRNEIDANIRFLTADIRGLEELAAEQLRQAKAAGAAILNEALSHPDRLTCRKELEAVRREIMRWIDHGRIPEAQLAAELEGDKHLKVEVAAAIRGKRLALRCARTWMEHPRWLDLPADADRIAPMGEILVVISRTGKEVGRFAVSPSGSAYPVKPQPRFWMERGGLRFQSIAA